MHPPHNIQYSGSKVYWKKRNLNLQISPNTDRRHLFLYFFLIKQPSIHFILQHQSDISTPIKRTNSGGGWEGWGGSGEHDQINYCSTDFIAFPDADRCFFLKTESVIEFLLNISKSLNVFKLSWES